MWMLLNMLQKIGWNETTFDIFDSFLLNRRLINTHIISQTRKGIDCSPHYFFIYVYLCNNMSAEIQVYLRQFVLVRIKLCGPLNRYSLFWSHFVDCFQTVSWFSLKYNQIWNSIGRSGLVTLWRFLSYYFSLHQLSIISRFTMNGKSIENQRRGA